MSEEIVGVVTDTELLWLAGASHVPLVARSLSIAGKSLHETAALEHSFQRSTRGPQGVPNSPGGMGPAFMEVRNELQRLIRQSVVNLNDIGKGLERIAWAYESTDEETAAEFNAIVAEHTDDENSGNFIRPGDTKDIPPLPVGDSPSLRPQEIAS